MSIFLWGQADFSKIHVSYIDSKALNQDQLMRELTKL